MFLDNVPDGLLMSWKPDTMSIVVSSNVNNVETFVEPIGAILRFICG
jgi:hypothetical protein